jgi:citrate lyase subunit beta/citryl-CoA lyase
MTQQFPVWRSMLFVPVTVEKFVRSAPTRGADAYILDLEDSVAPQDKARARTLVADAAKVVSPRGEDVLVRINRPLRLCIPDLEAVISPAIKAIMLPKAEGPEHVQLISETIAELEAERGMTVGHTKLVALIETGPAYWKMPEIAKSDPRLIAMTLGSEDFTLAMGMLPDGDGLMVPKQQTVFACRAAGIMPLGFVGSIAEFNDIEAFRAIVRRSKKLGFEGASAIHPNQVKVLNEEYRPSPAEVASAEKIIAAYEKSTAEGRGSIQVDGKMIDVPIVQRAERLLARHRAIVAKTGG